MATYTIVSADKTPLGPGEINAGQTISVAEGDVFIIDPTADQDVNFESASGSPTHFSINVNDSNSNAPKLAIKSDLTVDMDVAENVDIGNFDIDASSSDGLNLTAQNGVTMGKLQGSTSGGDRIALGDNFTALVNWDLHGGNDVITVGDDANFLNIKLGDGDDSLTFGDRATVNDIDGENGNDSIAFDDDLTANKVKGGSGDDTISVGHRANANSIDGESDNDTYNTASPTQTSSNMETTSTICFADGTLIATETGERPVEMLRPGDRIMTLDNGLQPLRWIGGTVMTAADLARCPHLRPIRIAQGALGPNIPTRDLRVSPQHRILLRSRIAQRMFGATEILVPACKLLDLPGVTRDADADKVAYLHILFDRHELVWADGAPAESLLIGAEALRALDPAARAELNALVPWRLIASQDPPARPTEDSGPRVRRLIDRHKAKDKFVFLA